MSHAIVDEFIDAMCVAGCAPASPSDIKPDDVSRYIDCAEDRRGSKKIKYVLKIVDGRGIGGFIHYRYGDWHTWVSSAPQKKYTPEQREAWAQKLEKEKQEKALELEKEHIAAAKEARLKWDGAKIAGRDHPYLKRKKIKGHGARIIGNDLIIPMYYNQKFWGYQSITPEGDKLYLKGGRKKGCFFMFAKKDDPKDVIIVCEGFSTGASIREATGKIVVSAFDAGNLEPVAMAFRAKYPDAKFYIAADNDQWSFSGGKKPKDFDKSLPGDDPRWQEVREAGLLSNTGVSKAQQAAVKIGAHVIRPSIPQDDPDKRTDFNDVFVSEGAEAVEVHFRDVPIDDPRDNNLPSVAQFGGTWADELIVKKDKKDNLIPDPTKSYNYFLAVSGHASLAGCFVWDEFDLSVKVARCTPWDNKDTFVSRCLLETDVIECDYWLQKNIGLAGSTQHTRSAIYAAAAKNPQHPLRNYFDTLEWDGSPRLDDWLITHCHAIKDDSDYVRAVGRTWLIAAVKRVYEPGCKFDHMLILEGDQSIGKSSTLKIMATFDDKTFFNENFQIKNLENKDELQKLKGVLIVELQEMAGFNKKDRDALTAFVTTTEDEYRKAYDRELQKYPRQFVLAGTYNPVDGLFTDPTGYRRYWCVNVTKRVDREFLIAERKQIWAEAVQRYKSGESLVLSDELYKKAHDAGSQRRVIDDWTPDVLAAFDYSSFQEVRDIMKKMGIDIKGRTQQESRRICRILKAEGFERVQKRSGGRSVWGWQKPEDPEIDYTNYAEEEKGQDIVF